MVVRLCPALDVPAHARWVAGTAPFTPDSNVIYECTSGYELTDGHLRLWCRKDGEWSAKHPNCKGNSGILFHLQTNLIWKLVRIVTWS